MSDKEKVIKGLREIYDEAYDRWVHRPYIEDKLITLIRDDIPDAIALLREQEPVEPAKVQIGNRTDCFCRNCTTKVGMLFSNEDAWRFHYKFCPYCGCEVKWDA